MIYLAMLVGLFLNGCLSAPTPTATPLPTVAPAPTPSPPELNDFRIVGYVTDWDVVVELIPFDKVTHLNYAFLLPESDGTVRDVANGWKLDQVVARAHAQGVKVLISVGGWGYEAQFAALAARPETRAAFVTALQRYVEDHALDGADIDWEYPRGPAAAQNYLALMQALRAGLPDGKLLTAAVAAVGENGDGILTEVFDQVDFLNLMAYDGSELNHAAYGYAEAALDYWSARGLPADKMVLGVPFYSRPGEAPYRKLMAHNPAAAFADELDYFGQTVYYNGIPTLQQKTRLARERASGLMIWALPHDTVDGMSLLKAIYEAAVR